MRTRADIPPLAAPAGPERPFGALDPLTGGRQVLASAAVNALRALGGVFVPRAQRPTVELAERRNRFVASISDAILILHASPSGKLDELATELLPKARPLWTLDNPANQHLLARGARPVTPATIEGIWGAA